MGISTGISWTDASWNPWRGCHKVSEGCRNCYAIREINRYGGNGESVIKSKTFNDPLKWKRNGKLAPGSKIFTCSWSDFFIEEADEWRNDAWKIIKDTPEYIYLVLTKRVYSIPGRLPSDWGDGYPNVWLGITVESNKEFYKRMPMFSQIPAAKKFLSIEPMLSDVELHWALFKCPQCGERPPMIFSQPRVDWRWNGSRYEHYHKYPAGHIETEPDPLIDWVITGGESGTESRYMSSVWPMQVAATCKDAGVAFFHKQMGTQWAKAAHLKSPHGSDISEFPSELQIQEFPKD